VKVRFAATRAHPIAHANGNFAKPPAVQDTDERFWLPEHGMRVALGRLSYVLAVVLTAGCGSTQSAGNPSSSADEPPSASRADAGIPLDRIAEFARSAVKGLGNPTDYSVTVVEASGTEAARVLVEGDTRDATTRNVYVIVVRGDLVCDVCSYPSNEVAHFRGGPAIYEVDESTLSVSDFYFLEPKDHQPDLAALGDPVSVPVG
jgi:hypothetical protein